MTADEVPEPTVLASIERLAGLGVRVGLATGRMAAANGPLLATGVFTGPHVFHNGAVVRDADGTDLVVQGLEDAAVEAVLAFGRTRDDVCVEVYVAETYLVDRDDPRSAPHSALLRRSPSGTIRTSAGLQGRSAVKAVVVCFTPAAAAATVTAMSALGLAPGPAASPATPDLRYVNVTRLGIDKGAGVQAAAQLLGIDLMHVAAVGDETNDIPVLRLVGTAIAMGDARIEVRSGAHLVAPRFTAGGTAAALDAIVAMVTRRTDEEPQRAPGTW